jgi:hypothetical protein
MTTPTTPRPELRLGDVIFDSYANPAVVVKIEMPGTRFERYSIMQTAGSDRGHVTSAPSTIIRVEDQGQIDWARDIVRTEAKRQGWKWNAQGITR